LTVGFTTTAISYKEPYVPEEKKPTLGEPILFSTLGVEGTLSILSATVNSDVTTYLVEVDGFAVLEADWETDPQPNVIEVKVNTASSTIVSVAYATFSDSAQFEYKTNHPDFLNQFAGLSLIVDNSVDVSVGATYTTDSVIRAVKAVIASALTPR
jgi:hypothetical protein